MPQSPASHAGAAGVEQGQQRWRGFSAQCQCQFKIALCRRRKVEQVGIALYLQALHMGQSAALRVLGVAEQCGRRGMRQVERLSVEALQIGDAKLLAKLARTEFGIKLPARSVCQGQARCQQCGRLTFAVDQQFGRTQSSQPGRQVALAAFGQTDQALRHR